jgi:phosphoglycolate phosphatase-like HAD superfamily hydrolase
MVHDLAARWNVDLSRSFMVGDSSGDVMTARNAGLRSVLVAGGMREVPPKYQAEPDMRAPDLLAAVTAILGGKR